MASSPTPDRPRPEEGAPPDGASQPDTTVPDVGEEDEAPRVLVLAVGGGWVAVAGAQAREVLRPGAVTPLAGAPGWIAGVTAVRGTVLPVADVARLAEVPPGGDWVLVEALGRQAVLAGVRAARVHGAREADPAGAAAAPVGLPVRGAVRLEDGGAGPSESRVRGGRAAPPRPAGALPDAPPVLPLLDVAALLDAILDGD